MDKKAKVWFWQHDRATQIIRNDMNIAREKLPSGELKKNNEFYNTNGLCFNMNMVNYWTCPECGKMSQVVQWSRTVDWANSFNYGNIYASCPVCDEQYSIEFKIRLEFKPVEVPEMWEDESND